MHCNSCLVRSAYATALRGGRPIYFVLFSSVPCVLSCFMNFEITVFECDFSLQPTGSESSINAGEEPTLKTAKKIYDKKFAELSGNDIFRGDVPPTSAEKPLSHAKLREISGSNIFADGKVESRDYLGGVRKPPGGESSIALV